MAFKEFVTRDYLYGRTDLAVEMFLVPGLLGLSPFGRQLDELSCPFKDVCMLLFCRGWSNV